MAKARKFTEEWNVYWVAKAGKFNPSYTAILLISIQVSAIFIAVLYPRHTWCRHFNCVRNCPNGSVQVNLRLAGREVWHLVRVNQGYVVYIGVMLAILVPLNYFTPLHGIWPSTSWKVWFSLCYWGAGLAGGILTWMIAKPFKTKAASLRVKLIFAFTPLVLAGHIMYQVAFIPGVRSLLFGVGYETPSGLLSFYIPATVIAHGIAATFGVVLTGITVALVLLHTKKSEQQA